MDNNQAKKVREDIIRLKNIKLHAQRLYIPTPKGSAFDDVSKNPHMIFSVRSGSFYEVFTGDGHLFSTQDGETFQDRIDKVIASVEKQFNNDQVSIKIFYYKDYKNDQGFEFKIYIQDTISNNNDGRQQVSRAAVAYFLENTASPENPDFYQITLGYAGSFPMPTEKLKLGEVDPDDEVTTALLNPFYDILKGVKYKNWI